MKKCDTCIYRNEDEYHKPCIVYRDDCEFYEREEEMTREEIIERIERYIPWADEYEVDIEALKGAIELLKQEPKIGHWIEKDGFDGDVYYDCSECGESWTTIEGTPWQNGMDYCPNCGCRMVESQESDNCNQFSQG